MLGREVTPVDCDTWSIDGKGMQHARSNTGRDA